MLMPPGIREGTQELIYVRLLVLQLIHIPSSFAAMLGPEFKYLSIIS